MDIQEVIKLVDHEVVAKTGKRLDSLQKAIIQGSWHNQKYSDISKKFYCTEGHIGNVAAELWKVLSQSFGETITKSNIKSALERYHISNISNPINLVQNNNNVIHGSINVCGNARHHQEAHNNTTETQSTNQEKPLLDLTDAPTFTSPYPRPTEIETLQKFIIEDKTRILTLLGLSGIGKTALTLTLIEHIQSQFDYIIYRTLDTSPTLAKILKSLLQFCHQNTENQLPDNIDEMREYLLNFLRCHRCLIILDDVHNILSSRELAGNYQPDKTNYSKLFKQIAEFCHQSCLILISWEPPIDIISLSQQNPLVKTFALPGLAPTTITEMWREMGLQDETQWLDIINLYQGNPLWLNLFAQTIQDLFNHSVAEFTELETKFLPTELQAILQQHWQRLSDIELKIIEILTQHPDGLKLKQITQKIKLDSTISPPISNKLINAVQSLNQRGLLEKRAQNKVNIFRLLPILEAILSPY